MSGRGVSGKNIRPSVPWNAATADAVGIEWLEAAIAPIAEFGRRARRSEPFFLAGDETVARVALATVARAAESLPRETVESLRQAIAAAPDPGTSANRAVAGDVLSDADFFELQRFLDALAGVRALVERTAPSDGYVSGDGMVPPFPDACDALRDLAPSLRELESALAPGRTPARTFFLSDEFEPTLSRTREEAAACRAAFDVARSTLAAKVAGVLGLEHLRDGEFILMRERLPNGVPAGVRVVREAPTYVLCELALDDTTLEAMRASEAAESSVAEAEESVRARLSSHVRAAAPQLASATQALGALDSFLGRVRFAQTYGAIEPEIGERGTAFEFEAARYLPLEARVAAAGGTYEPISLALDRAAVITGPNMGGKTAALRTCGFLAACVALGVPVPARRARLPLFDEIVWLGIGRSSADTSLSEGRWSDDASLLSAFGSELVEVRALLQRSATQALVLIDEFARTTSPREGRALLIALLQTLHARDAHVLAATHLEAIAEPAGVARYVIAGLRDVPKHDGAPLALEDALAVIAGALDHRPRLARSATPGASDVVAAGSDAFTLAEMLGLDRDFVERARRVL